MVKTIVSVSLYEIFVRIKVAVVIDLVRLLLFSFVVLIDEDN